MILLDNNGGQYKLLDDEGSRWKEDAWAGATSMLLGVRVRPAGSFFGGIWIWDSCSSFLPFIDSHYQGLCLSQAVACKTQSTRASSLVRMQCGGEPARRELHRLKVSVYIGIKLDMITRIRKSKLIANDLRVS